MEAHPYLIAAYAVTAVALGAYALRLAARTRQIRDALRARDGEGGGADSNSG